VVIRFPGALIFSDDFHVTSRGVKSRFAAGAADRRFHGEKSVDARDRGQIAAGSCVMALHGVARQIAFIEFLRNSRRPIEFPLRRNGGDRPSIAMGTRDSHDVRKRDASVSRERP